MTQDTTPVVDQAARLAMWTARRQVAVSVGVLLGVAGLLLAGRIGEQTWADVTIWTVGLYLLGEAGGAWAASWKRGP